MLKSQGREYCNVLQAAMAGGREKVVDVLLSKGIDVNAEIGHYGNALQAAMSGFVYLIPSPNLHIT